MNSINDWQVRKRVSDIFMMTSSDYVDSWLDSLNMIDTLAFSQPWNVSNFNYNTFYGKKPYSIRIAIKKYMVKISTLSNFDMN
jgi:hypothetical protein